MKKSWNNNRGRSVPNNRVFHGRTWNNNIRFQGASSSSIPLLTTPPQRFFNRNGYYHKEHLPNSYTYDYGNYTNNPTWNSRPQYRYNHRMPQPRSWIPYTKASSTPPKPPSPLPGSDEYLQREINEKSESLKRHLALEVPQFRIDLNTNFSEDDINPTNFCDNDSALPNDETIVENNHIIKSNSEKCTNSHKNVHMQQTIPNLSAEEIHEKIITHLSNLSYSKKMSVVNQTTPASSSYDLAVAQITRQKRLELSQVLRDMCNNESKKTNQEENRRAINSIIPDFDISIENLPKELVEQLSNVFVEDLSFLEDQVAVDPEELFKQAEKMLSSDTDVVNVTNLIEDPVQVTKSPTVYDYYNDLAEKLGNFPDPISFNTSNNQYSSNLSNVYFSPEPPKITNSITQSTLNEPATLESWFETKKLNISNNPSNYDDELPTVLSPKIISPNYNVVEDSTKDKGCQEEVSCLLNISPQVENLELCPLIPVQLENIEKNESVSSNQSYSMDIHQELPTNCAFLSDQKILESIDDKDSLSSEKSSQFGKNTDEIHKRDVDKCGHNNVPCMDPCSNTSEHTRECNQYVTKYQSNVDQYVDHYSLHNLRNLEDESIIKVRHKSKKHKHDRKKKNKRDRNTFVTSPTHLKKSSGKSLKERIQVMEIMQQERQIIKQEINEKINNVDSPPIDSMKTNKSDTNNLAVHEIKIEVNFSDINNVQKINKEAELYEPGESSVIENRIDNHQETCQEARNDTNTTLKEEKCTNENTLAVESEVSKNLTMCDNIIKERVWKSPGEKKFMVEHFEKSMPIETESSSFEKIVLNRDSSISSPNLLGNTLNNSISNFVSEDNSLNSEITVKDSINLSKKPKDKIKRSKRNENESRLISKSSTLYDKDKKVSLCKSTSTSVSIQTSIIKHKTVNVQTENENIFKSDVLIQTEVAVAPNKNLNTASVDTQRHKKQKILHKRQIITQMLDLDKEIERLTKLRQSFYAQLNSESDSDGDSKTQSLIHTKSNSESKLKEKATDCIKKKNESSKEFQSSANEKKKKSDVLQINTSKSCNGGKSSEQFLRKTGKTVSNNNVQGFQQVVMTPNKNLKEIHPLFKNNDVKTIKRKSKLNISELTYDNEKNKNQRNLVDTHQESLDLTLKHKCKSNSSKSFTNPLLLTSSLSDHSNNTSSHIVSKKLNRSKASSHSSVDGQKQETQKPVKIMSISDRLETKLADKKKKVKQKHATECKMEKNTSALEDEITNQSISFTESHNTSELVETNIASEKTDVKRSFRNRKAAASKETVEMEFNTQSSTSDSFSTCKNNRLKNATQNQTDIQSESQIITLALSTESVANKVEMKRSIKRKNSGSTESSELECDNRTNRFKKPRRSSVTKQKSKHRKSPDILLSKNLYIKLFRCSELEDLIKRINIVEDVEENYNASPTNKQENTESFGVVTSAKDCTSKLPFEEETKPDEISKNKNNKDQSLESIKNEEFEAVDEPNWEHFEVLDEDEDYEINFVNFVGSILVIRVIASVAIAASDKGKVFCFNMLTGERMNTFDISNSPITSLIISKKEDAYILYIGSLDSSLSILNFDKKEIVKRENIDASIQCMEQAWNFLFIGSSRGNLLRFNIKSEKIEDDINVSDSNVLTIKATQEGPRKVLVIATRGAPISIRDAMTGLLLRTMETPFVPTVYTLLFDKNLIYCGTSQHDILVYTFEDGQLIFKHEATKSKGVVCMQIVENLLFAGCYNGNIYVYNTSTNVHLGTMSGPGGLMLSMEIVRNKIIVGTKSGNFKAWKIPQKYLDHL